MKWIDRLVSHFYRVKETKADISRHPLMAKKTRIDKSGDEVYTSCGCKVR